MNKLAITFGLLALTVLARPAPAEAHLSVVIGQPGLVAVAPSPCGPAFVPGYYPYRSYYPAYGPFGFHPRHFFYDPWWTYRHQYFTGRTERIYGFSLPGRR